MLFVTGDTHIPHDISKLNTKNFPRQAGMTKADYVIICGDFGAVWEAGSRSDAWWLDWLEQRPFTTLFVDGNHENFDLLDAMPVERWNGGKVHRIRGGVLHLLRGQIFEVGGVRLFTMGGGASGDRELRTEGKSWWPREMPCAEEYDEARANLAAAGRRVDYVITHTAPTGIARRFRTREGERALGDFLEEIRQTTQYKRWYFGHVHRDEAVDERHVALYQEVLELETAKR